jgi:hypothetical protein
MGNMNGRTGSKIENTVLGRFGEDVVKVNWIMYTSNPEYVEQVF